MKRRLFLILLLLAGGAIINVAVAWGCAMWVDPWKGEWVRAKRSAPESARRRDPEYTSLEVVRASRAGATDILITWRRSTFFPHVDETPLSLVPAWTSLHEPSEFFNTGAAAADFAVAELRGWPMSALWNSHAQTFPQGVVKMRYGLQTPRTRPTSAINGVPYKLALPLQPIWPGFAINTVFWGVVSAIATALALTLRRWRRIKRGLCPKCAYDLRGTESAACPECGAAVVRRIRRLA